MNQPQLEQPPVDEIVRRIVETLRPRCIVMFGSRARDQARVDIDIDLFVELDDDQGLTPLQRAQCIHALFPHRLWSLDVVVYTTEEVKRFQEWKGTILATIREEGRVLYERQAA